jgi:hypothetical protein
VGEVQQRCGQQASEQASCGYILLASLCDLRETPSVLVRSSRHTAHSHGHSRYMALGRSLKSPTESCCFLEHFFAPAHSLLATAIMHMARRRRITLARPKFKSPSVRLAWQFIRGSTAARKESAVGLSLSRQIGLHNQKLMCCA